MKAHERRNRAITIFNAVADQAIETYEEDQPYGARSYTGLLDEAAKWAMIVSVLA